MVTERPDGWDEITDVVVLGSGGAGLTAAVMAADGGADVTLLEKAPFLGGTTGVSGGMPWIPMNRHMDEIEVDDSRDEAIAYLRRLTQGKEPDPHLVEVFVDTAAEMMAYLEDHTPVAMLATRNFADYYADLEGGKRQGRSIEPHPYDAGAELAEWAERLRTSPYFPPITMDEGAVADFKGGESPVMSLIAERTGTGVRTMGGALVAMLFKAVLERGVRVRTATPGRELVVDDEGAVIGVVADGPDGAVTVGARRGVVLATGGYEWNRELQRAFLPAEAVPLSPPGNEGDGLVMAMEVGAALGNMGSAWWYPAMYDPAMTYDGEPLYHLGGGRNIAGTIVVNRHGRRFVNEGTTYQDMPRSMQDV